ncbi:MAG: hypothetical protein Fur0037_16820 [Planctomycetota bacterium]
MKRWILLSAALLSAALASCRATSPRSNLRFAAASSKGFAEQPDGRLRADLGQIAFFVDLAARSTRIEVTAENGGKTEAEIRIGADGASRTAAIGEVWRRPIASGRGEDVPDAIPYRANDPLALDSGWRAVFFLDSPTGRDIVLGQQILLLIETRDAATGLHDHLTLPLVATNAPPVPGRR